jgi:hypothetical protein
MFGRAGEGNTRMKYEGGRVNVQPANLPTFKLFKFHVPSFRFHAFTVGRMFLKL